MLAVHGFTPQLLTHCSYCIIAELVLKQGFIECYISYLLNVNRVDIMEDENQSPMVKLISAEGHEFYVDRKVAMVSGTIRAMFSGTAWLEFVGEYITGQFAESSGEVRFPEIPSLILEKVIKYLYYKVRYTNSTQRVPNFEIEPEISLELLTAANYLEC